MSALADTGVLVIGIGQVGCSFARGLKGAGARVRGVDTSADVARRALDLGFVDQLAPDLTAGIDGAGVLIVAVPARATAPLLEDIAPVAGGRLVIECAGVKEPIERAARESDWRFSLASLHPMAGTEVSGPEGSDPRMYKGAAFVLTSSRRVWPEHMPLLEEVVNTFGGHMVFMDPDEHDQAVALTSHLPHIFAAVLMNALAIARARGERAEELVASSFLSATRVALADPAMVADFMLANGPRLATLLRQASTELETFATAVENGLERVLGDALARNQTRRTHLSGEKSADPSAQAPEEK